MKSQIKILAIAAAMILSMRNLQAQNIFPSTGAAGIGTTTPNSSALLDVVSTTKGVLIPRMTKTQRDAIVAPVQGLLIYQTNSTPGLYYYDGAWTAVAPKNASKTLNNLTAPTAVNVDLLPITNNTTSVGSSTLKWKDMYAYNIHFNDNTVMSTAPSGGGGTSQWTTSGPNIYYSTGNVGINTSTPAYKLDVNGTINLASASAFYVGGSKLFYQSGVGNFFVGQYAGGTSNTGTNNTTFGNTALGYNTSGSNNTAMGYHSLLANTTGHENCGIGMFTLPYNTTGSQNVAAGMSALSSNSTGNSDLAIGYQSLASATGGLGNNVAVGYQSMFYNASGASNTAVGYYSLINNSVDNNTAIGYSAGGSITNQTNNAIVGSYAGAAASNGTFIGYYANTNASGYTNVTAIGNSTTATASNQVRIGSSTVVALGGYASWTNVSDGRVKKNIRENVPGLAFINKLQPVTYNLDLNAIDRILGTKSSDQKISADETAAREAKEKIGYSGFIAQDVERAAKELNYDFSGVDAAKNDHDLYGLRYSDFVVPMVKAVQELSAKSDEQDNDLSQIRQQIDKARTMITSTSKDSEK